MFRIDLTTTRRYFDRARGAYRVVQTTCSGQPSWIGRIAAGAALLILTGIVIVIVLPALVVGIVVFVLLALGYALKLRLQSWGLGWFGSEGRRNVKVIKPSSFDDRQ